jgi:hypothetical protein
MLLIYYCNRIFGGSQPINVGKLLVEARHACIYNRGYLALDDLPPTNNVMVVTHFNSIQESLEAVMIAMKHHLYTCEMIDDTILDCTKTNKEQSKTASSKGNQKLLCYLKWHHI